MTVRLVQEQHFGPAEALGCLERMRPFIRAEVYRAGAFVDCQLDEADLEAGQKITCPVLAIWGDRGRPHKRHQVMETWRCWAVDVQGEGLLGHFLAEEAPDETRAALERFFSGHLQRQP